MGAGGPETDRQENTTPELEHGPDDESLGLENEEGERPLRRRPPVVCRTRMCRPCRRLCFPDPSKPKESCARIFCPSFLKARLGAARYRTSWNLLTKGEQLIQIRIFGLLVATFVLFLILAVIIPMTVPSKIAAYGAYIFFLAFSATAESLILVWLRACLKQPEKEKDKDKEKPPAAANSDPSCNSYLMVKWC